tara:strand:+ start:3035 stop:4750 length:1716 start_codon:yes stop_codon:yes gene_type:complete
MKNTLENDTSPYLQQHKNNPVFWQTWNKDSLILAKKEKKPILLSIGYASCHWCHVMAHESFEDQETANLMNKHFINIKVDREERPDIDFVFQNSYQLFNQTNGGWPLTIFLDENAVPFMAGTYFPPKAMQGIPSFKNVLQKVHETYLHQREKIINQSKIIKESLELKKNSVVKQDLLSILDLTLSNLDRVKGGFKGAPKFPVFNVFDSLLYFYNKTQNQSYIEPVELILKKICSQGIYDHTEGGISRYTIDEEWLIPHFEKMLYDNVQFIQLLSKFLMINSNDYFKKKLIQTISFIKKNFINQKNGLLGSAYDADSEGEEGKYYVYDYKEIKDIKDINKYFEINEKGNWKGKIILKEIDLPPTCILESLNKIRKKKLKPFFDDKTQLDLNSLWISGLLNANEVIKEQNYLIEAENFFLKIEQNFGKDNLFHTNSKKSVFLEDYAYMIQCLIDLYDNTLNLNYRLRAIDLTKECLAQFYDIEKNIFQKNKIKINDLFIKPIDVSDHTIPNGNSIMLSNFTRLGFLEEAGRLSLSLNGYLNIYKSFMISSLKSIDYFNEISSGKTCNLNGCKL